MLFTIRSSVALYFFVVTCLSGCFLFTKTESRTGYLEFTEGYCLLSRNLREKPELPTCKDTDKACKSLFKVNLFGSTDGLNEDFCKDNSNFIGHKIKIEGVRVAGDKISQNCTNRSCFNAVSKVD